MTQTMQNRANIQRTIAAALTGLALSAANTAEAQQALGVPFIGRTHLSFSVTDLSRDGFDSERKAVYGGVYGRMLNGDGGLVRYSVIARAGVRTMNGSDDAIVDAGFTLAATHRLRAMNALSITGAVGATAVVWNQDAASGTGQDHGRVITRLPLSAGAAYDLKIGGATIAPFVSLTGAYSEARNYVDDAVTSSDYGWRLSRSTGLTVRFRETVFSLSEVGRERGMPKGSRTVFSAGMSW